MIFFYWIFSYLLGNLLTAWWIGKWKKIDLRSIRSGNLGARNAGAVLGKTAFLLTFLGDALKGGLIISIGFYFNFTSWAIAIGGLLVILGHIYPFWLKFKGGKGIATFIGVALTFNPFLFGVLVVCFIILIVLLRSATLSMAFAFSTYTLISSLYYEFHHTWPLSLAVLIILIRHRFDLNESWNAIWWKKKH
jgi:glycerol-3-phosphate acyltransferase PlsY